MPLGAQLELVETEDIEGAAPWPLPPAQLQDTLAEPFRTADSGGCLLVCWALMTVTPRGSWVCVVNSGPVSSLWKVLTAVQEERMRQ